MSVPIRVVLQQEQAQKQVRDLRGRFADWTPVLKGPVRRLIRTMMVQQFRTRGRFMGTPWQALAKSTRDYKKRHPEWRQEILRRTDRLYGSLTRFGHPERDEVIEKGQYILRTKVPYAKYHQSEDPRTSNLPRRPIFGDTLPEPMMKQLRTLVKGYLIAGEVAR